MDLEEITQEIILGQGRSAIVLKDVGANGKHFVRKIFVGDPLGDLVHYSASGGPNPYKSNQDAILSAYYARNILSELAPYWLPSKLRVAKAKATQWNDKYKAYELQAEFVDGRHAALHHPYSKQRESELSDLVDNVMRPLQRRLVDSGFDGLVWQAGLGNPVASNNFLLENNDGENKWVWIDLESGVPALFPLNPIALVDYYLPKSLKHRHALFDDVDIGKLRAYVQQESPNLIQRIGKERFDQLLKDVDQLEYHQERYRSVRRIERSIQPALQKGRITQEQADFYREHPSRWHGREGLRLSLKAADKLADLPWEIFNKITLIDYKKIASNVRRFIVSEEYRSELARDFVLNRIDVWDERNHFEHIAAEYLRSHLRIEATTPYVRDLYAHALLKPVDWFVMPIVISASYSLDLIDFTTSLALVPMSGSILRTAYTGWMMGESFVKSKGWKKIPSFVKDLVVNNYYYARLGWLGEGIKYTSGKILGIERLVALGVGLIPQWGNLAYPVQMFYSESTADKETGKFMLYHYLTKTGENIPIFGGRDTRTEHFFNHIPDLLVRNRGGLNPKYTPTNNQ